MATLNNVGEIIARDIKKRLDVGVGVTAGIILANSRILAPKKTRAMADSGQKEKIQDGYRVGFSAKYAPYQERGFTSGPVRRYTTPGTQAHFLRDSVDSAMNRGIKL